MIDLNRLAPDAQRQIIRKLGEKPPKYRNRKARRGELTFDSKAEARRYDELRLMLRAGEISDLQRQVAFELIPAQKAGERNERACKYVADFVYTRNGEVIVEDVKGHRTPEYIIKRKLMLWRHGIAIQEVG